MMDEQVDEVEMTPFHAAEFLDPLSAEESKETNEFTDDDRKPNLAETSCPAVHLPIEPKQEGSSVWDPRAPASVLSQCSSSNIQLNLSNSNPIYENPSSIQLNLSSNSNLICDSPGNITSTSMHRQVKILRKSSVYPDISDGQAGP